MVAVALKQWLSRFRGPENRAKALLRPERHQKLEPFYRKMIYGLVRWVYEPEYVGFEKLPETGAAVIICNHVSYMDGPIISAGCERPIRFIIDDAIFRWPVVHYFMTLARAIPIAPKRESVERAFEEAAAGLSHGELISIFPEGQLTYTGSLSRFRPGVEFIIRRTPVPVYPMALTGLWGSIFSRKYQKSLFPFLPRSLKRRRVRVICGDPIPPEEATLARLQQEVLKLKYL